jgi:biogenesis of lysosome-related organelles complex 1 subunit 1
MIERRKEAALESVGVTTSVLLDSVNSGVAEVFVNQEELEREAKQLQAQSKRLASSANQWLAMVNELSTALKVPSQIA